MYRYNQGTKNNFNKVVVVILIVWLAIVAAIIAEPYVTPIKQALQSVVAGL